MERKEAIEVVRKNFPDSSFTMLREALKTLIPELKENEDEIIRKELTAFLKENLETGGNAENTWDSKGLERWIAWLEKQGKKEQLYIRFEEIPANEKSKIYNGEIEVGTENGVSVYPAFITDDGNIVLGLTLPITKTTLHTQQHLIEYDDRPCYLVKGDYVGKDTDGQPLINNISIIKKIDSYRVKDGKQCEQKHTWNEEDEMMLTSTINSLKLLEGKGATDIKIEWLKTLGQKFHWKPTEEQLQTLHSKLNEGSILYPEDVRVFTALYEDLLKL